MKQKSNWETIAVRLLYKGYIPIYLVARLNAYINNNFYYLVSTLAISAFVTIFLFRRFQQYLKYYSKKDAIIYLLGEIIPISIGVIYILMMEKYYFSIVHGVNFIYTSSLVVFFIPSIIADVNVERLRKSSIPQQ